MSDVTKILAHANQAKGWMNATDVAFDSLRMMIESAKIAGQVETTATLWNVWSALNESMNDIKNLTASYDK